MKVAITGDIHLTEKGKHPERWKTLENILRQITQKGVNTLLIIGDLFDSDYQSYFEFDKLTSQYPAIEFHIIPGNHDPAVSEKVLSGSNVRVYVQPEIVRFGDSGFPILLLPYKSDKTMGEEIATFNEQLQRGNWILAGHGDWFGSIRAPNPSEPGTYMPLSRKDVEDYGPALTLLAHIHKPLDDLSSHVHYVGSPCGLDITETGRRRYFILDTKTLELQTVPADSQVIYFSETIAVFPVENEKEYLEKQIQTIKDRWSVRPEERSKVWIRVKVRGYCSNIRELKKVLKREFGDFSFYDNEGADVSEVYASDNYELSEIGRRVCEKISQEDWTGSDEEPAVDDIIFHALETIYSIGK
ncbi:hypothetical protein E3J62_06640 [candidate division TA06 bacterium]|uniref:Calcineurin-like phosphoesterase domain-containing protein n=1 Tax=candidate division TA06 bacterium TaxID=2250710 RepID=A0A523UT63_UNCT6|nr:MAG: hypothetical protein E3J62_06640 [candidate division TA06 bacterium]